jgi:hypothetical protein
VEEEEKEKEEAKATKEARQFAGALDLDPCSAYTLVSLSANLHARLARAYELTFLCTDCDYLNSAA